MLFRPAIPGLARGAGIHILTFLEVSEILEGLDSSQRNAVECLKGPVLIVAGAGSGKTRVLTTRIAHIIEQGCAPERVLALTFTKKAAEEMKERIAGMVGKRQARKLYMGTFHSVFIRFLRDYSATLGYPQSFTIYDTSDSTAAIKTCLKELKLDDKIYKPKDVLSRISEAKNNLVTPEMYRNNRQAIINDTHKKKPEICNIYALYQQKMLQSGVMDFDDILMNLNLLVYKNPEIAKEIASRFDYIMVDEYQDTNYAQYSILRKLSEEHRNICVVGDDSQSIYAFRGAKIENILNFRKDYPGCNVFRLEQNYRSTKVIVGAANSVIEKNKGRIPKKCYSNGDEGEKIQLLKAYSEQEEAMLVASSIITRMQKDKAEYCDFAILYRTNSQSRALEEAFRKRNLPYMIYSGNSFFDRAEVKDMLAYFKLAVNPNDDESFKRIVNKPARSIGNTTMDHLIEFAKANSMPLFQAVYSDKLEESGLKPAVISKLRAFGDIILKANRNIPAVDAYQLANQLADDSGLYAFYKMDNSVESQSRASNIEELVNSVQLFIEDKTNDYKRELIAEQNNIDGGEVKDDELESFEIASGELPVFTLSAYLEEISLLSAVDVEDDEENNKIKMMTVHSAKGLEFPYVFIVGLEENLFPNTMMYTSFEEVEEERRLFYVALTRAEKAVTLSSATTRMRNGQHQTNPLSRFVREIDKSYLLNPPMEEMEDDDEEDMPRSFGGHSYGGRSYGMSSGITGGRNSYSNQGRYGNNRYGRPQSASQEPSTPKVTIPSGFKPASMARPKPVPTLSDADFKPSPSSQIAAGQRIEHNRFGFGKVMEVTGGTQDRKAKILFDNHGEKILLLNYAKIRIVEEETEIRMGIANYAIPIFFDRLLH